MAAIAWPTTMLPAAVLAAGYKLTADAGLIRTPMDTGLARQRKRFSNPPARVRVSWSMSGAQLAFFKSWLTHKAAYGGSFFDISLPLDEGVRSVEARFTGDPSYTFLAARSGGLWRVEADLEVKAPPPLSSDVVDIIVGIGEVQLYGIRDGLPAGLLQPAIDAWQAGFGA